jgi:hypothetical protein
MKRAHYDNASHLASHHFTRAREGNALERFFSEEPDRRRRKGGLAGFAPCHKGGENDCCSLCKECFDADFRLPLGVRAETLRWWQKRIEEAEA